QDEAAQLVTFLLRPERGQRILDACAAPGGKTLQIAELTDDNAEIIAVDQSDTGIKLLKENLSSGGYNSVRVIHSDILSLNFKEGFQRILVDAPCSSLGVIRRNPDVRYRHKPDDLTAFQEKQLQILLHLSNFLQKGGIMLYSVCSLEPEETTEVARKFLNKKKDFIIIDNQTIDFIPRDMITKEGYFFTLPHIDEMDGFFAVRFKRI
ncbi:MAG: RsmB/NOP family class I SAM-dependent RNA methyltransferase, partial [Nitrospirae bacterium]